MDQNLMATIGAIVGGTIPLGAVMFALIRWIDGRHRKDMALLREETKAGEGRIEAAIDRLREEMRAGDSRLESRIDGAISGFREDVKATEDRLRAEMQATEGRLDARIDGLEGGVKEANERLVNVGHRLSKVEGVIAGALMNAGTLDRVPVHDRRQVRETRKGAA